MVRAYDASYRGPSPNWDVGYAQAPFVVLEAAGYIGGRVLDVGCGTGELAMFLADRGYDVLGVDFAPSAIQRARAKAHARGSAAQFLVWDALRLGELGLEFDTVVDSAMFHVFGALERERFVDELASVLRPGGRYVVVGDHRPDDRPVYEGGISKREIRERFRDADGWRVDFVVETVFERDWGETPAYLVGVTRTR